MIGWLPTFDIFSENSKAPHKLKLSAKPIDLIFFDLQYSAKSSIFTAPSKKGNCE